MTEPLRIQFVGDLILDEPNPDSLFELSSDQLRKCDILVGHVEVPHTARGSEMHFDVPAPSSNPAYLSALQRAGFHAATLAGNHIADAGPNGVEDTRAELQRLGIAAAGAGNESERGQATRIAGEPGIALWNPQL